MYGVLYCNNSTLVMSNATELVTNLRDLEERRSALMALLQATSELAVGSLCRTKRSCGNPRCKQCEQGPSHEQVVFYYTTSAGKKSARFVRREEEPRFEGAADGYRSFRTALRELKALQAQELVLLAAIKDARALVASADEPEASDPGATIPDV